VIGDYGTGGPDEAAVAALVGDKNPDFVITTGDNNYPNGGADTIDVNIGQFYSKFIGNYRGQYGPGAPVNRFFPSLGNHDWASASAGPYLDYFTLPNNERYYDVVIGNVQLFALDSDPNEPDGNGPESPQAAWLKARLAASSSPWRVIYFHEPPYSSGPHGAAMHMRWPFREWGASIVFAGHDHIYERLDVEGLPYVVNGVGGKALYGMNALDPSSTVLHTDEFGALFVSATATRFSLRFITVAGSVQDELVLP
jgi:tartrate-resistant acid phosphatase type 5